MVVLPLTKEDKQSFFGDGNENRAKLLSQDTNDQVCELIVTKSDENLRHLLVSRIQASRVVLRHF